MQDQTALTPELAATDASENRLPQKLLTATVLGGVGAVTLSWVYLLGWGAVRLVSYLVG